MSLRKAIKEYKKEEIILPKRKPKKSIVERIRERLKESRILEEIYP